MENASKALIIAGAILLSILIIAISMMIFNSASDTLERSISRMTEQERQTFNARFQKFSGERRSGTDVKSLINELIQNYSTQMNDGEKNRIPDVKYGEDLIIERATVNSDNDNTKFNELMSKIKPTRTYKVDVKLNAADGIVTQINITEN